MDLAEEEEEEKTRENGEGEENGEYSEMSRELALTDPWEEFYYQNTHFTNADAEDSMFIELFCIRLFC